MTDNDLKPLDVPTATIHNSADEPSQPHRKPLVVQGISVEELSIFIENNSEYYIDKFCKMQTPPGDILKHRPFRNQFANINKGALLVSFLLGFYIYLCYRKMHLYGIIYFALLESINIIFDPPRTGMYLIITIFCSVIFSLFSDNIYLHYVRTKINKINRFPEKQDKDRLFQKFGGTDYIFPSIFIFYDSRSLFRVLIEYIHKLAF